jgi:hypothetical protein
MKSRTPALTNKIIILAFRNSNKESSHYINAKLACEFDQMIILKVTLLFDGHLIDIYMTCKIIH